MTNSEQQYIDLYNECRDIITANSAEMLNPARDKAFRHFASIGLPTLKVEEYK